MKSLKIIFFTAASFYSLLCLAETNSIEDAREQIRILYVNQIVSDYSNDDKMIQHIRGLCRARYGETDVLSQCFLVHMRALPELKYVFQNNVFVNGGSLTLNGTIASSCSKYYKIGDLHMMIECLRTSARAAPQAGMRIPVRSLEP